jgi:hypothetical protein
MTKAKSESKLFNIKLSEVKLPEISPAQIKNLRTGWVPYGKRNDFPDYLISASKKCTAHSSLLATRKDLISGEGVTYNSDKEINEKLKKLFVKINTDGESIEDILNQVKNDISILETMALQVIWSKDKKSITDVFYLDSSKIRPDKHLNERGLPISYWYCSNWQDVTTNEPINMPRFDSSEDGRGGKQIYFAHTPTLGQPYLPSISYASALNDIELAYEIGKYNLNYVRNGFFISGIFNVKTSSAEELYQADENIQNTFTGTDNAGRVIVMANDEGDGVTFTPLSTNDNTAMISAYINIIDSNVCTAHRANPIVAGIQSDGSTLGSDGKLFSTAMQTYYNLVIRDLQKAFISFWRMYGEVAGQDLHLDITSSALLQSEMPEELQAMIKPEVRITQYGYDAEDLIDYVAPTDTNPLNQPNTTEASIADIPKNKFE